MRRNAGLGQHRIIERDLIELSDEKLNPRLLRQIVQQRTDRKRRPRSISGLPFNTFLRVQASIDVESGVVARQFGIKSYHHMRKHTFVQPGRLIHMPIGDPESKSP